MPGIWELGYTIRAKSLGTFGKYVEASPRSRTTPTVTAPRRTSGLQRLCTISPAPPSARASLIVRCAACCRAEAIRRTWSTPRPSFVTRSWTRSPAQPTPTTRRFSLCWRKVKPSTRTARLRHKTAAGQRRPHKAPAGASQGVKDAWSHMSAEAKGPRSKEVRRNDRRRAGSRKTSPTRKRRRTSPTRRPRSRPRSTPPPALGNEGVSPAASLWARARASCAASDGGSLRIPDAPAAVYTGDQEHPQARLQHFWRRAPGRERRSRRRASSRRRAADRPSSTAHLPASAVQRRSASFGHGPQDADQPSLRHELPGRSQPPVRGRDRGCRRTCDRRSHRLPGAVRS